MSDNTMTTKTIEEKFQSCLDRIVPADRHAMELAKKRWDSVAKPIGSLGILEDDITRIAGIRRSASGITLDKSALAVMCADHGVVAGRRDPDREGSDPDRGGEFHAGGDFDFQNVPDCRNRSLSGGHGDGL